MMWFWATCQEQGIKEKGGREVKRRQTQKEEPEEKGETKSKLADEERGKCDVKDREVGEMEMKDTRKPE